MIYVKNLKKIIKIWSNKQTYNQSNKNKRAQCKLKKTQNKLNNKIQQIKKIKKYKQNKSKR